MALRNVQPTGEIHHVFITGESRLLNLLEFLVDVTGRVGKGIPVDTICLDFQNELAKVS